MPTPILEYDNVTFVGDRVYDSGISGISLAIRPGELAIVLLERERTHLPLADLAAGILAPDEGQIRFQGSDWSVIAPDAAADLRGRIGRVFEGNPWIDGIEMDQNIMLAEMHHTRRSSADMIREAEALSRTFDLPGLPLRLPSTVRGKDLVRAGCVRAFMGKPDLLVLERPTAGVYPELLPPLLNKLRAERDRGAAVFWLTDNSEVWDNPGVRPTLRGQMYGARMRVNRKESYGCHDLQIVT